MTQRPSSRIRAFLREELAGWRADGIVDERGAEALARRYGLDEPDGAGVAVAALYVLAACLVGAGIISLVAWHWEEMPRGLRLALLGTSLLAAHGGGYWLWQVSGRQPRLGHALSLLGTLIFGASIGLVAQIFNVSGVWYGFFGAWALGALAAGVALPSLPALAFAFILGLFVWGPGYVAAHAALGEAVAWPLGGLALALALRSRSRVMFLLAYVGLGVLLVTAAIAGDEHDAVLVALATGYALVAAAAALALQRQGDGPHRFAGVAGWLARLCFYVPTYSLSFHGMVRELRGAGPDWPRAWVTCALPAAVAAAALLAVGLGQGRRSGAGWPAKAVAAVTLAHALLFTLAAQVLREALLVTVLCNLAVLAVAGASMAEGLRLRRRAPFWEGLALATLLAASRFFEIESMLWLKGAGFIGCGVAVIAAGMTFERRVRAGRAEVRHA